MAHILIVDDDTGIRLLIRMILESDEHTVFEAQDGRVALDILETYPAPFDLIILDTRMPNMGGFEFLAELHNQSTDLPVIVLTDQWGEVLETLAHKISGQLARPFIKQRLIDMVHGALGERIKEA